MCSKRIMPLWFVLSYGGVERQQVTSEEDEMRKEGKLEKTGQREQGAHASRSGQRTGHSGQQYFAFSKIKT